MSANAISKYSRRVEALLETAITIVACDPQNDDVVYGFACGEQGKYLGVESPTIHYVWVRGGRNGLRRFGIASSLVGSMFPGRPHLTYTHITKAIHDYGLERRWNLKDFDPYFVEGALYSKARALDAGAAIKSRGGLVLSAGH